MTGHTAATAFAIDRAGLARGADTVLALLDGPVVDDGTACEIGLFAGWRAHEPGRKGIVGLVTDARVPEHEGRPALNLFVLGCVEAHGRLVSSVGEAIEVLRGREAEDG